MCILWAPVAPRSSWILIWKIPLMMLLELNTVVMLPIMDLDRYIFFFNVTWMSLFLILFLYHFFYCWNLSCAICLIAFISENGYASIFCLFSLSRFQFRDKNRKYLLRRSHEGLFCDTWREKRKCDCSIFLQLKV